MTPLTGYASRLSMRPGAALEFHVSGDGRKPVEARVVRVVNADPNPALGGVRVAETDYAVESLAPIELRTVPLGSFGVVRSAAAVADCDSFTVAALVWRGFDDSSERAILTLLDGANERRAALAIDSTGRFTATCGRGSEAKLVVAANLPARGWHVVCLSYDDKTKRAMAMSAPLANGQLSGDVTTAEAACDFGGRLACETILIGALSDRVAERHCFDGRIERPTILGRAIIAGELGAMLAGAFEGDRVAQWDFAREIPSDRIVDVGPHGLDGHLVNTPTRAVRGALWNGQEMHWRHAPEHYAAIHFHSDDIDDCRWPATHRFVAPADMPSGAYALALKSGTDAENIPFFVAARKGRPTAKIAVLVSTFTYTVYGNHARPEWRFDPAWQSAWRAQASDWQAYPHNPGDHRDLGLSTYNDHVDGSGISVASWHRPMLNVRLGYLTYPYPDIRASGLRHYPADSHLTQWLEAKGLAYDVITDAELHSEGCDLLRQYPVVLTGTHPEYHTRQMLDALKAYRDGGGRLAYLGGNGFYWKIALSPVKEGVIEIRRGEGGIRAWAAEPGEYYNQFDGEYGGLWRRNGRPPQDLCGVGFTAQGNFVGSHYRVSPDARSSRAGWIFDGLDGDTFGDHGFSGHGAAGFELDRADKALGTPRHAVVLASSEDHPPEAPWVLVPEERLTHLTTIPGAKDGELIRADMLFFETAGGAGAVFSTGSITFCGSLPTDNFENDVSLILENVVRRFMDPAPFPQAET